MKQVEAAWNEYRQQLLSFIRARVGTTEDADDILDDVFLKLMISADNNRTPERIAPWLYRVTRNRIVDYYRGKKNLEALPDDLSEEAAESSVILSLSRCMIPMIKTLSDTYQVPLMLSEIEGKKHKEVALALDLSVSAVKSRILRGREKLQKQLMSCCLIYRNAKGESVDYEQKAENSCSDCDR